MSAFALIVQSQTALPLVSELLDAVVRAALITRGQSDLTGDFCTR